MLISNLLFFIVAFIVALVERTCDEALSTWLLIYALLPAIAIFLICAVIFNLVICAEVTTKENEEKKELVMGWGILWILGSFLTFVFAWMIYGMVIFFPAAADHPCRVLVIVSTSMEKENAYSHICT